MKTNIRLVLVLALIALTTLFAVSCSKEEAPAATAQTPAPAPVAVEAPATVETPVSSEVSVPDTTNYQDGVYFAMADTFASSGWKETVTLTVTDGKIVSADWNAVHLNGGADKKTVDLAGKYNMVRFGGAQAEWIEQAAKVEAHLLSTQDPAKTAYDDGGYTDDIAGVSIHVNAFFELAQDALAAGPVGRGSYADGAYFAIAPDFGSSGWREYVSLTVVNGRIAAVNWSAVNKVGDDKKAYDKAGKYNMVAFGKAQAEWYQQAEKVEATLIATQDPTKTAYDDGGYTDEIAGVSIHVNALFELAQEALANSPIALGPYANGGYYATEEEFSTSGWKGFVSLFVSNGNIVSVNWSAVNKDGEDKKAIDKAGKYNMVAFGKAIDEWYVQAERVENYLLTTQDPKKISIKEGGYTDDIAGATIHVNDFFALVEKALAAGVKK
jgi:major membrane immunogen (membrane-anchored lipoprotein)